MFNRPNTNCLLVKEEILIIEEHEYLEDYTDTYITVIKYHVSSAKGKISLNSEGNLAVWRVKAQAEVADPSLIMSVRYNTEGWVKATVPGTVFGSYVSEGLEPDPNFGDNAYTIDKSKYDRNFGIAQNFFLPKWKLEKKSG